MMSCLQSLMPVAQFLHTAGLTNLVSLPLSLSEKGCVFTNYIRTLKTVITGPLAFRRLTCAVLTIAK